MKPSPMMTVRDRAAMIRSIWPQLSDGEFVYCSISNGTADARYTDRAIAMFAEAESRSFVLKIENVAILGFSCVFSDVLTVHRLPSAEVVSD